MAAGMSAPEIAHSGQPYGMIIVVGGGCYGTYYVGQLRRAVRAGAIVCERVLVVDRDAACPLARNTGSADPLVRLEIAEWREFFAGYLAGPRGSNAPDAIVPSPL